MHLHFVFMSTRMHVKEAEVSWSSRMCVLCSDIFFALLFFRILAVTHWLSVWLIDGSHCTAKNKPTWAIGLRRKRGQFSCISAVMMVIWRCKASPPLPSCPLIWILLELTFMLCLAALRFNAVRLLRILRSVLSLASGFPIESCLGFRLKSWRTGDPPLREGVRMGPGQSGRYKGVTSAFSHGAHSWVLWEQGVESDFWIDFLNCAVLGSDYSRAVEEKLEGTSGQHAECLHLGYLWPLELCLSLVTSWSVRFPRCTLPCRHIACL